MVPIKRYDAMKEIHTWAEKEREKNLKVIAQGATGAAAIKAALREANKAKKAAKLVEMEKGGSTELEAAQIEVANILSAARSHGRGKEKIVHQWEEKDAKAKREEKIVRHVSHHNVSHRVRKT